MKHLSNGAFCKNSVKGSRYSWAYWCLSTLCFLLFLSELSLLWRLCFCEAKTTNNAQNAIWCFTTSRTTRVKYKTTEECFFFFFSLLRETWLPSPSLFVSLLLSVSLLSSASLPESLLLDSLLSESLLLDSLLSESLLSLPSSGSCFTFGSGPGGWTKAQNTLCQKSVTSTCVFCFRNWDVVNHIISILGNASYTPRVLIHHCRSLHRSRIAEPFAMV